MFRECGPRRITRVSPSNHIHGIAALKNTPLAIANLITIITSQSLAAIATNLKVKGGGDYYLISRTLGYKFGGSIGIVLFLAQSVSVGFYCIGFAEAMRGLVPGLPHPAFVAAAAIGALFVLAWLGAGWESTCKR